MTDTIKIGTMGYTGAGKTCFMLGMYDAMRMGTEGFTIAADDPDVDLDFEAEWAKILDGQGQGRWPKPNDHSVKHRFTLNYGFKDLLGFEWVDYRGSLTREKLAGNEEVAELKRYFAGCHNIIAMISGENLTEPDIVSPKLKNDVSRINSLVTAMVADANSSGLPLPTMTIAITKADLLGKWDDKQDELVAFLMGLFKPLFIAGGGWTVMICPMTLGKGLAHSTDTGSIEPHNVHLPVAFAVEQWFVRRLTQLHGRQDDLEAQRQRRSGGALKNWWNEGELETIRQHLDRSTQEMNEVVASISILRDKMLKEAIIYSNGQRISS